MKWLLLFFLTLNFSFAEEPKFAPFAEPGFPFLESTVDFRDWDGADAPKENLVVRGVIIKLGQNCYACYDTDLLRLAAIWEGDADQRFLTYTSIASISYEKAKMKSEAGQKDLPKPVGRKIATTGRVFGQTKEDPRRVPADARELGRGPVDETLGRWEGVEIRDGVPVVRYRLGAEQVEETFAVTREGSISRSTKKWSAKGAEPTVAVEAYQKQNSEPSKSVAATTPWSQSVEVTGSLAPDLEAYSIDDIPLPLPNPWKRNVRLSGIDFFPDGRAALCTLDGDVWIVSGLEGELKKVEWRRFASGLGEPQSIAVAGGELYVFTRNGIERLHAGNDGICNFYEMFCNKFVQTAETREFPMDMVKKPGGGFYIAKGGPQISSKGDGAGRIYEVSADGKSVTEVANGFRQPYLGIHPVTGVLTASDQQGNYVPTTPIHVVKRGSFYGFPDGAPSPAPATVEEATCWIPHEVNQSAAGQLWCVNSTLGSLEGHLLHLGYFKSAVFEAFIPHDEKQAAVVPLPWKLDIPILKGAMHPKDGSLFLCGLQIWGAEAPKISGLKRVRLTAKSNPQPVDVRAVQEGVVLQFSEPLDEFSVAAPEAFLAQRWNYKRTPNYGSAHYKIDGTPGHELLPVVGAILSKDAKSVFLRLDGMVPVMQLQVDWDLKFANGTSVKNFADFTIRSLEKFDFAKGGIEPAIMSAPAISASQSAGSTEAPTSEAGRRVALQMGCLSCHSVDGKMEGMKGPSWYHLFGAEVLLTNGQKVLATEDYIKESVMDPTAKVRKGFNNPDVGMPPYAGILSDSQLESVILYFKDLAK